MRQWVGTVNLCNGKFWRSRTVRVTASTIHVAASRAVFIAKREQASEIGKTRIEGVRVELTAVKSAQLPGSEGDNEEGQ